MLPDRGCADLPCKTPDSCKGMLLYVSLHTAAACTGYISSGHHTAGAIAEEDGDLLEACMCTGIYERVQGRVPETNVMSSQAQRP